MQVAISRHRLSKMNHEITPKISARCTEIIPKIPTRCTVEEYGLVTKQKNRFSEDQQKLADRILKKSEQLIDTARSKVEECKNDSEYRIKERLENIQFLLDEVLKQKKAISLEEEAVKIYCKRLFGTAKFMRDLKEKNQQQCDILKENKSGVELTNDSVDIELRHEMEIIIRNLSLLEKTVYQAAEQIRLIRSVIYLLDREMQNKGTSLQIDKVNLALKSSPEQCIIDDNSKRSLVPSSTITTHHDWEEMTHQIIQKALKNLNCSVQLRSYIDVLLKQTMENIAKQVSRTTETFRKRISKTRYDKTVLEGIQKETTIKLNDVLNKIAELKNEITEKDKYVNLCQTRLSNRAQRPGPELCRDRVQETLMTELRTLEETLKNLNLVMAELEATKRYLLHTQMVQEEELNVKLHRLKVDEVDCMTIRDSIDFINF